MEKVKIMYESSQAAEYKTITGWVSSDGRYWGEDEHMARWAGCTHKICECGNETEKSYIVCEACRAHRSRERYDEMPFKEWDGTAALVIYNDDQYFFSEDDLLEYCENHGAKPEDLMLCLCKDNRYQQVDEDYWQDVMPEDEEIEDGLRNKLKELNAYIDTLPAASYSQGKHRTQYRPA